MSVSVSMPQLGESVTEGTVTRWLKKEGERVEVDEPLLEVSTDKVDTEIPSPASGILRGIAVDEDETVAVGAQLAVIEDSEESGSQPAPADSPPQDEAVSPSQDEAVSPPQDEAVAPPQDEAVSPPQDEAQQDAASADGQQAPAAAASDGQSAPPSYAPPAADQAPGYAPPPAYGQPQGYTQQSPYSRPAAPAPAPAAEVAPPVLPPSPVAPSAPLPSAQAAPSAPSASADSESAEEAQQPTALLGTSDAPYVTPLVRKLAAEHAVNLDRVAGTGVGGRIRKQDVVEAARTQREAREAQESQAAAAADAQPSEGAPAAAAPQPGAPAAAPARPAVAASALRGTTQRMSRPRQVIAQRMVESLRVSAQLTTVVEVDVTAIARLRERAKREFEAREGVKLSFLPFFAQAAMEALKVHPKLNAVIDGDQVTYHDTEHLGIAVDTERGLMVPVIHNAGDLNIGGLARKIGDLAERTRSGRVGPDELAGGTFTLTNTGSRGALFDTPIINQPQVAILGTGTVVKRPVVVEDPALGEVIAVRSMVYLALTYDHRLVDGADAARFLTTVKNRLEEGSFEAELGL
jgi:2-oxoglutarate dehydrogenase E2 component (dihydrolipoamide succinyltransferase)